MDSLAERDDLLHQPRKSGAFLETIVSCLGGWDHSQLHHQTERIHNDARFFDSAFLQTVNHDAPNPDWFPRRGTPRNAPP